MAREVGRGVLEIPLLIVDATVKIRDHWGFGWLGYPPASGRDLRVRTVKNLLLASFSIHALSCLFF